jgi:hypothetical protein
MKKVMVLFFGLVLLSQVLKFYELGQPATVKRQPPERMQPARPHPDGAAAPEPRFMLAGIEGSRG